MHTNRYTSPKSGSRFVLLGALLLVAPLGFAQEEDEEVFTLSPFEIKAGEDTGYRATSTLAGTRLRTELKDVGTAIQAITEKFMDDVGATDNTTLLQYTTNTEVAGTGGNFAGTGNSARPNEDGRMRNPDSSTRVRGLTSAENTRDYYNSIIPWDGYNVERVDIQRGANSVLFGLGSPAGIVNADIVDANLGDNSKEVGIRFDKWGSVRLTFDMNQIVLPDELSVRVSAVRDNEKYQQNPAFENDQRLFLAARYEPNFLKSESARSVFRAKYESGSIERNAPRLTPPVDRISPFFETQGPNALNAQGVDVREANDNASRLPGTGIRFSTYDDNSTPNPAWNPWINDMTQVYGGLLYVFDQPGSSVPQTIFDSEAKLAGALGSNGAVDNGIDGWGTRRLVGIRTFSQYALEAGLPNADKGVYRDTLISDPGVFDFYNNLIEGPNKGVDADFDALNLAFEQTFFDNRLGFEIVHDKQTYKDEQLTHVNDWRNAISIDINETLPTGAVNPNFGRPFVSDAAWLSGNAGDRTIETNRASVYYDLDFSDVVESEFLTKLLGKHTFNLARSEFDSNRTETRFQRYATDAAYGNRIGVNDHQDNRRQTAWVTYLGPRLTSLAGANLSPITGIQSLDSGQVLSFDTTWSASGVDPSAPWTDPYDGSVLTQSENPANYVGYAPTAVNILNAANPADRAAMLRQFQISEYSVESNIALWQGRLWGDSILPMLAVREEKVLVNSLSQPAGPTSGPNGGSTGPDATIANIDSIATNPNDALPFDDNLVTKGLIVHVDRLLGSDTLPFNLSLFYSKSENFNPSEARTTVFGDSLTPPTGTTTEKGFLVTTKDNKFSARVNWYKTSLQNATDETLQPALWQLGIVENWALNNAYIIREMPQNTGRQDWEFLSQGGDESDAAFLQRRIDVTQVFLDNPLPREFHEAWGIANIFKSDGTVAQFDGDGGVDLSNFLNRLQTANQPLGLVATSDIVSEGVELELHAQPTDNWSISFNAAKTEATNSNVGGALADFIDFRLESFQEVVNGIRLGDARVWGTGTGGGDAFEARYADLFGLFELQKLQEGSTTSELREWRANLVTNYSFTDGKFSGANVGMGYRWQGKTTLGFPLTAAGEFDLTRPYEGPSEGNFDFWVGYGKRLSDNVDWRIQLNVSNAFEGNNLIPVTVQPDGTYAGLRMGPRQSWALTNTFKF